MVFLLWSLQLVVTVICMIGTIRLSDKHVFIYLRRKSCNFQERAKHLQQQVIHFYLFLLRSGQHLKWLQNILILINEVEIYLFIHLFYDILQENLVTKFTNFQGDCCQVFLGYEWKVW